MFTDGLTSQFKQHYLFSNLADWEKEFSVKIIWNFFSTLHGKGAVDRIGGTVKRFVWRHVQTTAAGPFDAESYAKLAKEINKNMTILYVSSEAIAATTSAAKLTIWKNNLVVPNTMKMDCSKVHNSRQLEVSTTSVGEDLKNDRYLEFSSSKWWEWYQLDIWHRVLFTIWRGFNWEC